MIENNSLLTISRPIANSHSLVIKNDAASQSSRIVYDFVLLFFGKFELLAAFARHYHSNMN